MADELREALERIALRYIIAAGLYPRCVRVLFCFPTEMPSPAPARCGLACYGSDGAWYIFLNRGLVRLGGTLLIEYYAHELGHVVLGHCTELGYRAPQAQREAEAQAWAAEHLDEIAQQIEKELKQWTN